MEVQVTSKYEVGDRFETRDSRDEGKIVEIIEVLQYPREVWYQDGTSETLFGTRYRIKTEVNPKNPSAVGRRSHIAEHTLETRYRKISR